jgi:DNA modification methylase
MKNIDSYLKKNIELESGQRVVNISCNHHIYFEDARKIDNFLEPESVHLIVTSPPYNDLKDYGNPMQIGFGANIENYRHNLIGIFQKCECILKKEGYLAIVIGDQFIPASPEYPYHILPLHSFITEDILNHTALFFKCAYLWEKVTTSNTSGGGSIMGSVNFPRNPIPFQNYEHILLFQKLGKNRDKVNLDYKLTSGLSIEKRRLYTQNMWKIKPEKQTIHKAMFPIEIPQRIIALHTFVGDVVCDPFLGSGSTTKVASLMGHNSIGFEIGFEPPANCIQTWQQIIEEKVQVPTSIQHICYTHKYKKQIIKENILLCVKNKYYFLSNDISNKPINPRLQL